MLKKQDESDSRASLLEESRGLFDAGMPLQAWRTAAAAGDPERVTSAAGLIFLGRLTSRLGDEARSSRLIRQAWRADPALTECLLYRGYRIAASCGPVSGLRFLLPLLEKGPHAGNADLMALAARCYSLLGDEEPADRWIGLARTAEPDSPWILTEQSVIEESRDRREEALLLARGALELRPRYRPAVMRAAVLLSHAGRDAEALALLEDCAASTEWAEPMLLIVNQHSEAERPAEALAALAEYERRIPLRAPVLDRWIAARKSSLLLRSGDPAGAADAAEAAGDAFHRKMAARLRSPEAAAGRRVMLPVGFVRQHDVTCAPATLTALARYWGREARHLEVAEKICHNGTPSHSQRQWAKDSGLCGREFRVTPQVTVALLERGVPFTLVTTWPTGAHLQAVIGHDSRAGLLLIRDPTHRHHSEAHLEGFLSDHAAHGPRGMLVLPEAEAHRLEGLELPESELYDTVHAIDRALENHDRASARELHAALQAAAPDHRLTHESLRSLAAYDQDTVKAVEALEGLRRLFPDNAAHAWHWYECAQSNLTRAARLEFLEARAREHRGEPVFPLERASLLGGDTRAADAAAGLLTRHLRRSHTDARALRLLAESLWRQDRCAEALSLHRWHACLEDKDGDAARLYFDASLRLRRTGEALAFLRRRFQETGGRSAEPGVTLCDCLLRLHRHEEADEALAESARRRPDDARLAAHAAEVAITRGQLSRAAALLVTAESRVPRPQWLRLSARLAEQRMDPAAALDFWKQALADAPLAMDAHAAVTRLTADREGVDAALARMDACCALHPAHAGLARLRIDWLREQRHPDAERRLVEMLEAEPADAWAWRELALERMSRQDPAGAAEAMRKAAGIAPREAVTWTIFGWVHQQREDRAAARVCYRRALGLDVGAPGLMSGLLRAAERPEERAESLEEIARELEKQVLHGGEMRDFLLNARPWLPPARLMGILRDGHAARGDLWTMWTALSGELTARGQHDEALEIARGLTERFPWLPAAWLHLARTRAARRETPARLEALDRALAINPGWQEAARERIDALDMEGRREEAVAAAREGVRVSPLEGASHGYLGDLLLRGGAVEEGLACMETAVRLFPGYEWGWDRLAEAAPDGPGDRLLAAAEAEAARRPGDAGSWIILARARMARNRHQDALDAVDRGLTLSPRDIRLLDQRAWFLFAMDRPADAIAACSPPVFGENPPRELRARKGWILLLSKRDREAVSLLEELTAEEKDQSWPLELLHHAHFDAGRHGPALDAANLLRDRWPEAALGHRRAAETLVALSRHPEAAEAALTALRIDPYDARAASLAFDGQLLQGETEGAAETLGIMRRLHPGPPAMVAEVRMRRATGGDGPAGEAIRAILHDPSPEAGRAFQLLTEAKGLTPLLRKAIDLLPDEGYRNTAAHEYWADRHFPDEAARWVKRLKKNTELPVEIRDSLIEFCLYRMVNQGAGKKAVWTIRWSRGFFRSTTALWGAAGYVYHSALGAKAAGHWHRDWSTRGGIKPYMLHNCAIAAAETGGPFAAEAVWRAAADAPSSGPFTAEARAGLALCHAMRGETERAEELLARNAPAPRKDRAAFFTALAECAAAAYRGEPNPAPRVANVRTALSDFANNRVCVKACQILRRELKAHRLSRAFAPRIPRKEFDWGNSGGIITGVALLMLGTVGKCAREFSRPDPLPDFAPLPSDRQPPRPPVKPSPPLTPYPFPDLPADSAAEPPAHDRVPPPRRSALPRDTTLRY